MLEDRAGGDIAGLARAADLLTAAARKRPELGTVISTFRPSVPGYSIDMDTDKLQTMGIPVTDAYNTLQTFLGGLYVNDFNQFGHTWQVLLQAEPEFRDQPSSIGKLGLGLQQHLPGMAELVEVVHVQAAQKRL